MADVSLKLYVNSQTDTNMYSSQTYNVNVGDKVDITGSTNPNSSAVRYGLKGDVTVPGCTYSYVSESYPVYSLNGTLTTTGTYVLQKVFGSTSVGVLDNDGAGGTFGTVTLNVTSSEPTQYTVSFNSNGGSASPADKTVTAGNSFYLPDPGTKSGYTFDGWYTLSSGGTFVGWQGSMYTPTSSVTLYAQWSEEEDPSYTYTLKFDANGGSGAPSTKTVTTTSTSYNMQIPYDTPTKSGYTFKGWELDVDPSPGVLFQGGEYVTFRSDQLLTMTMVASWQKTTYKYTLAYNANGGSNAPSSQSVTLEVSGDYTFNVSSTTPTRDGYKFLGWSKSSSATSPSYYAGDSISVSANSTVTLYAVWESTGIQGLRVNVAGTWYNVDAYVNVNGVWKQVTNAYVNVAGSWKEV